MEAIQTCQEKILKMALQFDQELATRDSAFKKLSNSIADDLEELVTQKINDAESSQNSQYITEQYLASTLQGLK